MSILMRILLLSCLLGKLIVTADAQSPTPPAQAPAAVSFVDPTVRILAGSQDGTSEISLRTRNPLPAAPVVKDFPLPHPPTATVIFDPVKDDNPSSNLWRYRVIVSGLTPANTTQQRYALVNFADTKDQPIPYLLSNQLAGNFSWNVSKLPDPWVATRADSSSVCTTFSVTPKDSPATGVTINSTLVEQTTKSAITIDKLKLCLVDNNCESTQSIDLPANVTSQLKMCTSESFHGNFHGVVTLSARQKPDGEVILQNALFSSLGAKLAGFGLIFLGVYLAWLSKVWARSRVERNQALLPSVLMRSQLETLRQTIQQLPEEYRKELDEIPREINKTFDELSTTTLDGDHFLPPKFPGPFGYDVNTAGYKSYLEARNPKIELLSVLVKDGVTRAVAQDNGTLTPQQKALVKSAIKKIDGLINISTDQALAQIREIIADLKKQILGEEAAALEAVTEKLSVSAREFEILQLEIQSISKWVWLIYAVLTALTGLGVLILNNPGFGVPLDFLFAFFWGFGLPTTIQALAPGSAASALNISVAKV